MGDGPKKAVIGVGLLNRANEDDISVKGLQGIADNLKVFVKLGERVMDNPELLADVVSLIECQKKKASVHLIDLSADPMPESWKKNKWTIKKHKDVGQLELNPSQLKLHFSPNQIDGKVISGNKLRNELETNNIPVLNACVLEHLLAHPELIPEDWKADENGNMRYIYFWGTIYRGQRGRLCVRYLCWDGGAWDWYYDWLDDDWGFRSPAASLA